MTKFEFEMLTRDLKPETSIVVEVNVYELCTAAMYLKIIDALDAQGLSTIKGEFEKAIRDANGLEGRIRAAARFVILRHDGSQKDTSSYPLALRLLLASWSFVAHYIKATFSLIAVFVMMIVGLVVEFGGLILIILCVGGMFTAMVGGKIHDARNEEAFKAYWSELSNLPIDDEIAEGRAASFMLRGEKVDIEKNYIFESIPAYVAELENSRSCVEINKNAFGYDQPYFLPATAKLLPDTHILCTPMEGKETYQVVRRLDVDAKALPES